MWWYSSSTAIYSTNYEEIKAKCIWVSFKNTSKNHFVVECISVQFKCPRIYYIFVQKKALSRIKLQLIIHQLLFLFYGLSQSFSSSVINSRLISYSFTVKEESMRGIKLKVAVEAFWCRRKLLAKRKSEFI